MRELNLTSELESLKLKHEKSSARVIELSKRNYIRPSLKWQRK